MFKIRLQILIIFLPTIFLSACGGGSSGSDENGNNGSAISTNPAADVIIVIDSSGSMADELLFVQNELVVFFNSIASVNIDLRIILIAEGGAICIPSPVGSGGCPLDENLPNYRHDQTVISSTGALTEIITTYPNWSSSLRSDASKTIIVVTDDNSASSSVQFGNDLVALDSSFTGFRFHAFVASVDPPLFPMDFCFGFTAARGEEYINLVTNTGGVFHDICNQAFAPGFNDVANAVIADSP